LVYVVGAADKAAVKPVQVDTVAGGDTLLTSGLDGGERVVIEGQSQLRPGAKVSVRQPAGAATAEEGGAAVGGAARKGGKRAAGGGKRPQ
jgi:hypothetical protein